MMDDFHYRVIASLMNVAVVEEESVGEGGEASKGFGIVGADGFFTEVATGHDENTRGGFGGEGRISLVEKKMVQRRVGEHDAERIEVGGDVFAGSKRRGITSSLEEDNWFLAPDEQFAFGIIQLAKFSPSGQRVGHDRKRLVDAAFAAAEFGNGIRIRRVAGEVESAEAFDGEDVSFT